MSKEDALILCKNLLRREQRSREREINDLQHELGYADMTIRLQEEQLKTAARLMRAVRHETRYSERHHCKAWDEVEWFIANFDKK